ncbi:MAG: TlpA disulfide reductase family protein [Pseudomonadota bacterium]
MPGMRMLFIAAVVALAAGAVVYGIVGDAGNPTTVAECQAGATRTAAMDEAAVGELAAFVVADAVSPLVDLAFVDEEGAPLTLDDWSGKVTLINLWATWCVPCREEMPDLDNLKGMFSDRPFDVVAISLDRAEPAVPIGFLEEINAKNLVFYHDQKANSFNALKEAGLAFGLPATVLIDENGCRLGHLPGPAKWDGDDAQALIRAALPS